MGFIITETMLFYYSSTMEMDSITFSKKPIFDSCDSIPIIHIMQVFCATS